MDMIKIKTTLQYWIIGWISALILFNMILIAFVGWNIMNFSGYEWFITAVTVGTVLLIVGMGYISVKFLFNDTNG